MSEDVRKPDAYESEYMAGDEVEGAYREKMSYPAWFRWFIALAVAGALGTSFYSALQAGDATAMAMLAATAPVMFFFLIMASTLRVTVTADELAVQYGPLGPKIPIDRIEHCEAEKYSVWKYGGYGIRYSVVENAWCYNMIGDKGKAVRVHYRDAKGRLKKVLIASAHHHVLADSINRARVARGHEVPEHLVPDEADLGLDEDVYFAEETGESVEAETEVEAESAVGQR